MTALFRRVVAFAVVVAVPFVGAATAPAGAKAVSAKSVSAKTVPPDKWATKFCTALGDWQNTLEDLEGQLEDDLATISAGSSVDSTAMARAKTTLDDFLGQTVDATDTAIRRVSAAGVPDTTNGKPISKSIVNALTQAKKIFESAQNDVVDLQTSDPAQFAADTQGIAAEIQSTGDQVTSAFDRVDTLDKGAKLAKVVKAQRACAFLKPSA